MRTPVYLGNYNMMMSRLSPECKLVAIKHLVHDTLLEWPAHPVIAGFVSGQQVFNTDSATFVWCREADHVRRMMDYARFNRLTIGFFELTGWGHDYLLYPLPPSIGIASMAVTGVQTFLNRHNCAVLQPADLQALMACWVSGHEMRFMLRSGFPNNGPTALDVGWPDERGFVVQVLVGHATVSVALNHEMHQCIRNATARRWPEVYGIPMTSNLREE